MGLFTSSCGVISGTHGHCRPLSWVCSPRTVGLYQARMDCRPLSWVCSPRTFVNSGPAVSGRGLRSGWAAGRSRPSLRKNRCVLGPRTNTRTHAHHITHAQTRTHTHTISHTHKHTHTHTHTHTYTHAHKISPTSPNNHPKPSVKLPPKLRRPDRCIRSRTSRTCGRATGSAGWPQPLTRLRFH